MQRMSKYIEINGGFRASGEEVKINFASFSLICN